MLPFYRYQWFRIACYSVLACLASVGLTAQSLSIVVPNMRGAPSRDAHFNWQFESSGGGNVQMGQFACGSYWIAPANGDSGIKLLSLTGNPAWTDYLSCDSDPIPESMGLLSGAKNYGNYNASENLLSNLPATITPSSGSCVSLVAAMRRNEAETGPGGTSAIVGEVADAYCVVTVMPAPPANSGSDMIRPNITGTTKEFLTWSDLDLSRIPTYSFMSGNGASGWLNSAVRWSHSTEIFGGMEAEQPSGAWKYYSEGGRAFRAHILTHDYAAGMTQVFNNDVLALFSSADTLEQKKPGLAAMLSFGLDIYHARYDYGSGYRQRWSSGAGQHGGKFLPCALLASLLYDTSMADELRKVAINNVGNDLAEIGPQELRQIPRGRTGVHLWGDGYPVIRSTNQSIVELDRRYWADFRDSSCYDTAVGSCNPSTGKKTSADPYGYHDGPSNKPGSAYMAVSFGGVRGMAAAMILMPDLRSVVNTDAPIEYADRVVRHGLWTAPDPIAAISVTDQGNSCNPWASGANCSDWGVTWGPNLSDTRFGIEGGSGRFASLHGATASKSYETGRAVDNWSSIIALYDGETYEDTMVGATTAVAPDIFFETGPNPKVHLLSPNPDAEIRYTLDGTDPSQSSALYSGPVAVSTGTEVRVKSYVSGLTASAVHSKIYDFQAGTPDTEAPSVPTGLTASNITDVSVDLDWNASTDNVAVTSYRVYINGTSYASVTGTSITVTDLMSDTSYTFTVSARDAAANESSQSSGVNVTTEEADTTAPSVPTGLAASNLQAFSVDLDWNASTDDIGVTGYKVYTNGSNPVSVTGTSITLTGLIPGTSYAFSVSAEDAAGNESSQSSAVNVTTASAGGTLISEDFTTSAANFTTVSGGTWSVSSGRYVLSSPNTSPPGAGLLGNISVHNTTVSGDFWLTATLRITGTGSAWNDAVVIFGYQDSSNYYYFSLNESNDDNTQGIIKVENGTPTQLADSSFSVASDTDYDIEILRSGASIIAIIDGQQVASATDSTFTSGQVGFGSFNDGAQFDDLVVTNAGAGDTTAPSVPTGLSASNVTTSSVNLSWTASTDDVGVTGYKVYTNGSNPVSVSGTSTTINNLSASTSYAFTVSAVDAAANESSQSSAANVTTADPPDTTAPSVPTGLAASNATASSIDLSWNASTDNVAVTGYKVYTNGVNPVSVSGTSTTISGLSASTSYAFSVSAVDAAANESSQSSAVNASTTAVSTTNVDIEGEASDQEIYDTGGSKWAGQANIRVGGSGTSIDAAGVFPFELPELDAGETITAASFTVNLESISGSPTGALDLYGLDYRSSSAVSAATDYFEGTYGTDSAATAIDNQFATTSSSGALSTDSTGESNLLDYINAQYTAGAVGGDYIFLRLNPSVTDESNYAYWLVSSADASTQANRPVLSLEISGSAGGDTEAPSVPTGLASSNVTDTSVDLSWNASTDNVGVTGYKVYTNGSSPITVTTTSLTLSGLSASTSYAFTVSAYDAASNESSASSAANVTTDDPPDTTAPSVPTGLASSNVTTTSVDLSWNDSTDNVGVTGYKVYTNGSNPITVTSASASISGLSPSTSYAFTVSAVDAAANESSASSALNVTTDDLPDTTAPSVPTGLASSNVTTTSVDLSWNAATDNVGVTGYKVYTNGANPVSVSGASTTISSLASNISYAFTVSALDLAGNESAQSSAVNVTTLATSTSDMDIEAEASDQEIYDTGGSKWSGQANIRVGGSGSSIDAAGVFPFELPELDAGETITAASFTVNLESISGSPTGAIDLYGLDYRSSSAVSAATDYFEGTYDTDSAATAIDNQFATTSSSGALSTDATGESNLLDYINAQYTAGAVGGDYIFLRLNPSVTDESNYAYWLFSSANATTQADRPVLTLEISSGSGGDSEAPSVPTGLASGNVTDTSVDLSWNASTDNVGVTGYKVYTGGANPVSVSGTTVTLSGLTESTSYAFTVSAVDAAANESAQSSAVNVTTDDPPDTEAPSVPTGLASSNVTTSSVDLSWNASSDNVGVTGYKVYTNGANPVSVTGTSITFSSLTENTSYTFTVSAVDAAANESSASSAVNVTTASSSGPLISEDFASGGANFSAVLGGTWGVSSGRYVLSSPNTSPPAAGILGNISVHDTLVTGDFILTAVLRITGTGSSWNDAVIVFGYQDVNNYYYLSLNESNDGFTKGLMKVVNGTPTEMADITISVASDTDYPIEIQRSGASIVALVNGAQVASASDSTFTSGRVGFGSFNDGAQFDGLEVAGSGGSGDTTAPSVPTGLAASNITANSVDLDWNASTDNVAVSGYKVYTGGANPVSVTGTSVTITGLTASTSYAFTVSAYDTSGNESAQSSAANATTASSSGASYYVDPASGSMSNPGTSSQPWSTLEAVFTAGKTFNAGDVIYLRDGHHGYPTITGNPGGTVTIQPQSGHSPTARQVLFDNASNFILNGVEVNPELESAYIPGNWIVTVNSNCSEIEVSDCLVQSATSISGWTESDWASKAARGITCSAPDSVITGNTVRVVYYGIFLNAGAVNSEASYNTIEEVSVDGIRTLGNYQVVEYNLIRDFYDVNDDHRDGIQSYTVGAGGVGTATLYGTVIRGNVIIAYTSASLPYKATVQGVGCFDGFFEDWVVENNIVCVDQWHGIAFLGARNCLIVNNTVVENPIAAFTQVPWIAIWAHKNGAASTGNIVRNNLVSDFNITSGMATVDNNIETSDYTSHFEDYSNLDLHLKSTSSAVDAGSSSQAPTIDFEGDTRDSSPDIGADEL